MAHVLYHHAGLTIPVPSCNTTRVFSDLNNYLNTQGKKYYAVGEDQTFGLKEKHREVWSLLQKTALSCIDAFSSTFGEHVN